jgi:hypothetical protein
MWMHEFVTERATEAASSVADGAFKLFLANSAELLSLVNSQFSTVNDIGNLVRPLSELLIF